MPLVAVKWNWRRRRFLGLSQRWTSALLWVCVVLAVHLDNILIKSIVYSESIVHCRGVLRFRNIYRSNVLVRHAGFFSPEYDKGQYHRIGKIPSSTPTRFSRIRESVLVMLGY